MGHYIAVANRRGKVYYLTPRRATGLVYESRSTWSPYIDDAKVFNTRGSATNSARQNREFSEFEVFEVKLNIVSELD